MHRFPAELLLQISGGCLLEKDVFGVRCRAHGFAPWQALIFSVFTSGLDLVADLVVDWVGV